LKEHCKAVGRDEETIGKTWSPEVFIRETEAELREAGSRNLWGEPFESWRDGNLVGTPEQVADKIATYVSVGCTGFIPWCPDYPSTETMTLLAEKVMPEFR
jgi:alkanesulfonate monooxygenase SsuD/methylene tetrahydromethanopterin reductase-like flavin-dependent oxidoreductase (luciferase family)